MGDNKFTKTDMERMGLFQEMGYTTIGDKYKFNQSVEFNESASKSKQMLPGGTKTRSALQAGFFSDKFARIMENEAYSDPIKLRRQHRFKEGQKNIAKPFLPSNGDKKMSGVGSHYGTLSGPIGAFSPQDKERKAYKSPGHNFYTNPGKRGTGYGYVGVTIGEHQKHQTDEYDRAREITRKENEAHRKQMKGSAFKLNMAAKSLFDGNPYQSDRPLPPVRKSDSALSAVKPFKPSSPGKLPAGMKAGTFDQYPSHSADPYNVKYVRPVHVVNKSGKTFMPSAGPKSAPVTSVLDQNVTKSINVNNYKVPPSVMSF